MESIELAFKKLKKFENGLAESIEDELTKLRSFDKNILAHVSNQGFTMFKLGDRNLIVTAIHNGNYVPNGIELKQTNKERKKEEDLFTGELYLPLFLEKGGVFINTHISRYLVDLNRPKNNAILSYEAKEGNNLANTQNEKEIIQKAEKMYDSFYTLFNKELSKEKIVFNGHSMHDSPKRGDFCLIYPIKEKGQELKRLLENQGFKDVRINDPYFEENGNLMKIARPKIHKDSIYFETNKKLYINENTFEKLDVFDLNSKKIYNALSTLIKRKNI